jgi:hypothetical protein
LFSWMGRKWGRLGYCTAEDRGLLCAPGRPVTQPCRPGPWRITAPASTQSPLPPKRHRTGTRRAGGPRRGGGRCQELRAPLLPWRRWLAPLPGTIARFADKIDCGELIWGRRGYIHIAEGVEGDCATAGLHRDFSNYLYKVVNGSGKLTAMLWPRGLDSKGGAAAIDFISKRNTLAL